MKEAKAEHTRDQRRALYAYQKVRSVDDKDRQDYKIAVNDLGANILRSGLCAAIAAIQRTGDRGKILLEHLARAKVPGLETATADNLLERAAQLSADEYILATREMLQVSMWLKRAVQATFKED